MKTKQGLSVSQKTPLPCLSPSHRGTGVQSVPETQENAHPTVRGTLRHGAGTRRPGSRPVPALGKDSVSVKGVQGRPCSTSVIGGLSMKGSCCSSPDSDLLGLLGATPAPECLRSTQLILKTSPHRQPPNLIITQDSLSCTPPTLLLLISCWRSTNNSKRQRTEPPER